MNKTLIIYSTVDGQTRAICELMKGVNQAAESEVTLASLEEAKALSLADFDKVMIGASIRYGKHRPELYQYINNHHAVLSAKPNAFLQ